MRVKIGPYIYRWTSKIHTNYMNMKYGYYEWEDNNNIFEKYLEKLEDALQSLYNVSINKYLDKKQRRIKVHIDGYDVWGADHTLALIILPTLKKLKENKHGSPFVEPEDVPEELRPTEEPGPENGYIDNTIHERWEWVMNEMIWAFEQIVDEDNDSSFFDHSEITEEDRKEPLGGASKIKIDYEGLNTHNARIKRGTILFGKYYQGLWD